MSAAGFVSIHGRRLGLTPQGLEVDGRQMRAQDYGEEVFYVHSGTGDDDREGKSPLAPMATLDAAVGRCRANKGDIIVCMPGHSESVSAAAGIDLDVAGITVLGMGNGEDRATFTFDTAITADMDVDAANVTLVNLLFVNGIDNLTAPIDVNAADFTMIGCECRDNDSSYHCDDFIVTDANADRLQILDHVHRANGGKAGAQTAMSIVGGSDHVIIPRWIDGAFATACIENVTTACDSLQVFGRGDFPAYLRNRNSADVIFTSVATTKGRVGPFLNARLADDATNITEAFVGADMEFFQPINIVNADGESSMQTNITASTDA